MWRDRQSFQVINPRLAGWGEGEVAACVRPGSAKRDESKVCHRSEIIPLWGDVITPWKIGGSQKRRRLGRDVAGYCPVSAFSLWSLSCESRSHRRVSARVCALSRSPTASPQRWFSSGRRTWAVGLKPSQSSDHGNTHAAFLERFPQQIENGVFFQ